MSFCDHCEGQRFDRARVLRALRAARRRIRRDQKQDRQTVSFMDETLVAAIEAIRSMDIPHLERFDEIIDGELIH